MFLSKKNSKKNSKQSNKKINKKLNKKLNNDISNKKNKKTNKKTKNNSKRKSNKKLNKSIKSIKSIKSKKIINHKGGRIPIPLKENPFVNNQSPNIMRLNNYVCLKENTIKDLSNTVYELFGRRVMESDAVGDFERAQALGLNQIYRNTQSYAEKQKALHAATNFNDKTSLNFPYN